MFKASHSVYCFLQTLVSDNEHLPLEQMAVFYEGQPLEDDCQLAAFRDESTLNVELRLLGGRFGVETNQHNLQF